MYVCRVFGLQGHFLHRFVCLMAFVILRQLRNPSLRDEGSVQTRHTFADDATVYLFI